MATPFDLGWPNWFGSQQKAITPEPQTAEINSRGGVGGVGPIDRIRVTDNITATGSFVTGAASDWETVRNFEMGLIAANIDSIDGFSALTRAHFTGTGGFMTHRDHTLWDAGAAIGTPKTTNQNFSSGGCCGGASSGGAADLWGITPTISQLNGSGFGLASFSQNTNGINTYTFLIDSVVLTSHITGKSNGQWHGGIFA